MENKSEITSLNLADRQINTENILGNAEENQKSIIPEENSLNSIETEKGVCNNMIKNDESSENKAILYNLDKEFSPISENRSLLNEPAESSYEQDNNAFEISNPNQLFSPSENLSELILESQHLKKKTEISNDLLKKQPIDYVVRSKIFIETMIFNKYFYIHADNSKLMYAKRSLSGFNIYNIEDDKFIGKLRANIFGTKYTFEKFLEVSYETSFLDKEKPRALKIKLNELNLINKKPYFNTETNSFSLNFSRRVTKPSVKNFQIIHPLEPTYITLTFGKEENNSYILDYSHPWSILSAFCVGLSALDHKFGCD